MAYTLQREWGTNGTGDGQFQWPSFSFVYADEVYVADSGNHRIQVFDLNGVFQRKWGSLGTANGQFNTPQSLWIDSGEVYVTDYLNHRVQVFDTNGVFQRKWGSGPSSANGNFNRSYGITVYGGEVYVSDLLNYRVQVFTPAGVYQRKWGSSATLGLFIKLFGYSGEIYHSDFTKNYIQVWSTAGVYSRRWTLNAARSVYVRSGEVVGFDDYGVTRFFDTTGTLLDSFTSGLGSSCGAIFPYTSTVEELFLSGNGWDKIQVWSSSNPTPTTVSISPDNEDAGQPGFTLTVYGTNFVASSVVRWNSADKATVFVSDTELTATIDAADIVTSGTASIEVFNPTPGGGLSNVQIFTINVAGPTMDQIMRCGNWFGSGIYQGHWLGWK